MSLLTFIVSFWNKTLSLLTKRLIWSSHKLQKSTLPFPTTLTSEKKFLRRPRKSVLQTISVVRSRIPSTTLFLTILILTLIQLLTSRVSPSAMGRQYPQSCQILSSRWSMLIGPTRLFLLSRRGMVILADLPLNSTKSLINNGRKSWTSWRWTLMS